MNTISTSQDPDRIWAKLTRKHRDNVPLSARSWLLQNESKLGSYNGFPGLFHRQHMIRCAIDNPGCRVCIATPHGGFLHGAVRIPSEHHVVFDIAGSRHGQPGIADEVNIIWCSKFKL